MKEILIKLKNILTRRDKNFFLLLVVFSMFISIIEVVGISIIMPFLSISMDFTIIHTNEYISYMYNFLKFKNEVNFIIVLGIVLFLFYILRSGLNIYFTYLMAKFSQGRYHLIVYKLFENYMGMSYKNFVNKNSSTLTKSIISEANNLAALISALLLMISEVFIVIFLYIMMLYVNYKITLLITVFLLINAGLILKTVSVKMKSHGSVRASIQKLFYEIINKSFGNFKLIKLQTNDKIVLNEFEMASHNYAKTNIFVQTMIQVPKFLLEAIGFGLIILIVVYLIWKYENNVSHVIAMLSMFVLALYRLMPSANRIMNSYNQILFAHKALDIIHSDLMYDSENLGNKSISFNKKLNISNLNFQYETGNDVLKNLNLTIQKGEKIAFIGESGSGKSTLVDIIMGLYKVTNGQLKIDDIELNNDNIKQWRSKIGYIPQTIYLFDGTVKDNIAFGCKYDEEKVIRCLKQAKIYDFLEKKKGLDTKVGEGGIMLSGGQKQRIAIARALYSDPEVLVLDEATSALDDEIEKQIMNEIYEVSKDKTLIIIAHRLSTLDRCETIYKLESGMIVNE